MIHCYQHNEICYNFAIACKIWYSQKYILFSALIEKVGMFSLVTGSERNVKEEQKNDVIS